MVGSLEDRVPLDVHDGCVVRLTFVVVDAKTQEVLDREHAASALEYIHGSGQLVLGFEEGLLGLCAHDCFEFDVPCAKAYGVHNPQMVQKVERAKLSPDLRKGMVVRIEVPGMEGLAPPLVFHVVKILDHVVHMDGNHPFAGRDLRFMGKVRSVRQATAQELRTGCVDL